MHVQAFLQPTRLMQLRCWWKSNTQTSSLRPTFMTSRLSCCTASTVQSTKKEIRDMREFYQITEKPNIKLALKAAIASANSLGKYLQYSPVPMHTQDAFDTFRKWRQRRNARKHLCIDAGCGQAWSTLRLAQLHPDCDVVGIDKSAVRLHRNAAFRHGGIPRDAENALILQADLIHFWRLCWEHGIRPDHQYILYPNPYPKSGDLKRRWHGHPVFPLLVGLGGRLVVRTSWDGYLREFRVAYQEAFISLRKNGHLENGQRENVPSIGEIKILNNISEVGELKNEPLSNFEAKYHRVGLPVHQVVIEHQFTLNL